MRVCVECLLAAISRTRQFSLNTLLLSEVYPVASTSRQSFAQNNNNSRYTRRIKSGVLQSRSGYATAASTNSDDKSHGAAASGSSAGPVDSHEASSSASSADVVRARRDADIKDFGSEHTHDGSPPAPRNEDHQAGPARSSKTLALARWTMLRHTALQALEARQRMLRQRLSEASTRMNDVTGYKEIEALKNEVTRKELELLEARAAAREAKDAHATALSERIASGREVNDLLQRKNNWLETDVLRFTELVRLDHVNEQKERDRKIDVAREEEAVERKIGEMMQSILRRYHEEQVWSDKIRSLSTYGSLAITSINVVIFLLALILVEPWKRRRMVSEVEDRIRQRDEVNGQRLGEDLHELRLLVQKDLPDLQGLSQSGTQGVAHEPSTNPRSPEPEDFQYTTRANSLALTSTGSVAIERDTSQAGEGMEVAANTTSACNEEDETMRNEPPRITGQRRDLWYAGVGGSIFGAAAVSIWHAVFR